MASRKRTALVHAALLILFSSAVRAQSPAVSRDADGHITVRAVRTASALRIDGKLDEEIYAATEPIGGFVQQEPDEGRPATERTEAWVFFDDDNIYVSARCWDTHPERRVANEM